MTLLASITLITIKTIDDSHKESVAYRTLLVDLSKTFYFLSNFKELKFYDSGNSD